MDNLPESFRNQLIEESDSTLEAMLVALHETILSRKKAHKITLIPPTPTDDEAINLTELIPNFIPPKDRDVIIPALLTEAMDLGLHTKSNSIKVPTQWLTLNGDTSYNYGGVSHKAKCLSDFPNIKHLLGLVNSRS